MLAGASEDVLAGASEDVLAEISRGCAGWG